jgi:hypothetical protein
MFIIQRLLSLKKRAAVRREKAITTAQYRQQRIVLYPQKSLQQRVLQVSITRFHVCHWEDAAKKAAADATASLASDDKKLEQVAEVKPSLTRSLKCPTKDFMEMLSSSKTMLPC